MSKEDRNWQGKVWGLEYSLRVVLVTRGQQRKIMFFLSPPPLFLYWMKSNQIFSGANFIPYHLIEARKSSPCLGHPFWSDEKDICFWGKTLRTALKPPLIAQTEQEDSHCWSICELSSVSLLLQKLKQLSRHFFFPSWEDWCTSSWKDEPISFNSHWMFYGCKEEGKIGTNFFWKKKKRKNNLLKSHSI